MTTTLLPPIVAAGTITDSLGREWDPIKHPRGRDGRFIHTFKRIRAFLSAMDTDPWMTGEVTQINDDGSIRVRIKKTTDPNLVDPASGQSYAGQEVDITPDLVESINEKAVLDLDGDNEKAPSAFAEKGWGGEFSTWQSYLNRFKFGKLGSKLNDETIINKYIEHNNEGRSPEEFTERLRELGENDVIANFASKQTAYLVGLRLRAEHLRNDNTFEGNEKFRRALSEMGVPEDVIDDTPDGMSGVQWLADEATKARYGDKDPAYYDVVPMSTDVVRETRSNKSGKRMLFKGEIHDAGDAPISVADVDQTDEEATAYPDIESARARLDEPDAAPVADSGLTPPASPKPNKVAAPDPSLEPDEFEEPAEVDPTPDALDEIADEDVEQFTDIDTTDIRDLGTRIQSSESDYGDTYNESITGVANGLEEGSYSIEEARAELRQLAEELGDEADDFDNPALTKLSKDLRAAADNLGVTKKADLTPEVEAEVEEELPDTVVENPLDSNESYSVSFPKEDFLIEGDWDDTIEQYGLGYGSVPDNDDGTMFHATGTGASINEFIAKNSALEFADPHDYLRDDEPVTDLTPEEPEPLYEGSKFTKSQIDAIDEYVTDSQLINNALRSGDSDPEIDELIAKIDSAMEQDILPEGVKLYRGMRFDEDSPVLEKIKQGGVLDDSAYVSTTTSLTAAQNFAQSKNPQPGKQPVILTIVTDRDTPNLDIGSMYDDGEEDIDESEHLLPHGTGLEITEASYYEGVVYAKARILRPDEVPADAVEVVDDETAPAVEEMVGPLTELEAKHLDYYGGQGARKLNRILRGNASGNLGDIPEDAVLDDEVKTNVHEMTKTLDALIEAQAEVGTYKALYRGMAIDPDKDQAFLDSLVPGATIVDKAFMSTSTNPDVADSFADGLPGHKTVTFAFSVDEGLHAINMDSLNAQMPGAYVMGENEFLFGRNVQTVIEDVQLDNDGNYTITAKLRPGGGNDTATPGTSSTQEEEGGTQDGGVKAELPGSEQDGPSDVGAGPGDGDTTDGDGDGEGPNDLDAGPGGSDSAEQGEVTKPWPLTQWEAPNGTDYTALDGGPLEADELDALESYTGVGFIDINSWLRDSQGETLGPAYADLAKQIDSLDKLVGRSKLTAPMELFRGLNTGSMNDEDRDSFMASLQEGAILSDKAFLSTSMDREVAWEFSYDAGDPSKAVLFELDVPAGHNAVDSGIKNQTGTSFEQEIILARDSKFRIDTIMEDPDLGGTLVMMSVVYDTPAEDADVPGDVDAPADPVDSLEQVLEADTGQKFEVLDDPGTSGDGYYPSNDGSKLWGKYGAAGVMVRNVDENGVERYLMVQRGPIVSTNKGKWQLPGGALNSNENDYQGTARELNEELQSPDGWLDNLKPAGEVKFDHPSGWHYNNIAADSNEMFEPTVDGTETGDAKWFTKEEIAQLPLHPALAKNLDAIYGTYPEWDNSKLTAGPDTMPEPNTPTDTPAPALGQVIDATDWNMVGGQQGSNKGGTFTDDNGQDWYVKRGKSEEHAKNEALAAAFYKEAGIPTAELQLADTPFGGLGTASPLIPGAKSDLRDQLKDPQYKDDLAQGFAMDAWLANWDVAGLVYDNIVSDENGVGVRIDPGGALLYRAQGAPKGGAFGDAVGELQTLKDKANTGSRLFDDMTFEDEKLSAEKVLNISPERIDELVDSFNFDPTTAEKLKDRLKARREFIANHYALELPENKTDAPDVDSAPDPDPAPTSSGPNLETVPDNINLNDGFDMEIDISQSTDPEFFSKSIYEHLNDNIDILEEESAPAEEGMPGYHSLLLTGPGWALHEFYSKVFPDKEDDGDFYNALIPAGGSPQILVNDPWAGVGTQQEPLAPWEIELLQGDLDAAKGATPEDSGNITGGQPGPDSEDWEQMVDAEGAYRYDQDGNKLRIGSTVVGADGVEMTISKFENNNKGVIALDAGGKKRIRHRKKLSLVPITTAPDPDVPVADDDQLMEWEKELLGPVPGDTADVTPAFPSGSSIEWASWEDSPEDFAYKFEGFVNAVSDGAALKNDYFDAGDGYSVTYDPDKKEYQLWQGNKSMVKSYPASSPNNAPDDMAADIQKSIAAVEMDDDADGDVQLDSVSEGVSNEVSNDDDFGTALAAYLDSIENGTWSKGDTVKYGDYLVTFDRQSGEITLSIEETGEILYDADVADGFDVLVSEFLLHLNVNKGTGDAEGNSIDNAVPEPTGGQIVFTSWENDPDTFAYDFQGAVIEWENGNSPGWDYVNIGDGYVVTYDSTANNFILWKQESLEDYSLIKKIPNTDDAASTIQNEVNIIMSAPSPAAPVTYDSVAELAKVNDIPKNIPSVQQLFNGNLSLVQAKQYRNAGFALNDAAALPVDSAEWNQAVNKAIYNLTQAGPVAAPKLDEVKKWRTNTLNFHSSGTVGGTDVNDVKLPDGFAPIPPDAKAAYQTVYPSGKTVYAIVNPDSTVDYYYDDGDVIPAANMNEELLKNVPAWAPIGSYNNVAIEQPAPTPPGPDLSQPHKMDADGNPMFIGDKVYWTTKGQEMTVHKFENNDIGVIVINADGTKKHAINRKKLKVLSSSTQGPVPSSNKTSSPPSIVDKPAILSNPIEPDTSSPLFGTPQPAKPELDPSVTNLQGQQLVDDAWLKKADEHYKNRMKLKNPNWVEKDLSKSSTYADYQLAMKGDKSALQRLFEAHRITHAMREDALTQIDANNKEYLEKYAEFEKALEKWQADVKEWRKANGLPGIQLMGMDSGTLKLGNAAAKKWMSDNQVAGSLNPNGHLSYAAQQAVDTQKGSNISYTLRAGKEKTLDPDWVAQNGGKTILGMDQAMLESPPLKHDFNVVRTFDMAGFINPATGERYKNGDNLSNLAGTIQHDWGFAETSVGSFDAGATATYMAGSRPIWMEMRVPAGTRAVYTLGPGMPNVLANERGLILERGIAYYIHSVQYIGGKWRVHAEMIPKSVNYDQFGHFLNENPFFN